MRNQVSLTRPGSPSSFTAKGGIAQEWMTSVAVTSRRMLVSTGSTRRLSVSSSQIWPCFRSFFSRRLASKVKLPLSGYS